MNLEEFLDKRLTREQLEILNTNSKIERVEEGKEDKKNRRLIIIIIIIFPNELADMINSDDECKVMLKDNIVEFMRSLKRDFELEKKKIK
ncbi:MAG: hypothetical protein E6248_12105 [Clostridium sp.]|uniref:hypothetical protein n=1 Tax=Clostridium sp. TaxID=1506 RepID=UPI0029088022|nr:hypothetical protein [Clostridium sp.]MDU5111185.1 hypothetical protein [Clostridium sp.]